MRSFSAESLANGTDAELIEVADWRARFEVARALARGEDPDRVRRLVIERFRDEIQAESFGEYTDEVLMAAMQRGVDHALTPG